MFFRPKCMRELVCCWHAKILNHNDIILYFCPIMCILHIILRSAVLDIRFKTGRVKFTAASFVTENSDDPWRSSALNC